MYLLDTNTLIYFFKNKGQVATHILQTSPAAVAVSTVTIHELEVGILKTPQPAKQQRQLDEFLTTTAVWTFDTSAAKASTRIRVQLEKMGLPIGPLDTLIAGIAIAHGAILVTHNHSEFGRVPGLQMTDWYT